MNGQITTTIKGNTLVIELPIHVEPSKSGKTMLLASTGGFQGTTSTYQGKPVKISVNACIPK